MCPPARSNAWRVPQSSERVASPFLQVEVITPEESMGDVIGDLNSRRGIIDKMGDRAGNLKVVTASVPLAEMFNYVSKVSTATARVTSRATERNPCQTLEASNLASIPLNAIPNLCLPAHVWSRGRGTSVSRLSQSPHGTRPRSLPQLRGMTKGRANYTMVLDRYEAVPPNIQDTITKERAAAA